MQLAYGQFEVDSGSFAGGKMDAFAPRRPEARQLDIDAVEISIADRFTSITPLRRAVFSFDVASNPLRSPCASPEPDISQGRRGLLDYDSLYVSLSPETRLGPYEIVGLLGAGGMGEVYRARDPRLGRDVAVKVLPSAFSADLDRLRRFEQEARAAAALNHPNILAVYDIGTHDAQPYVVAELLEGEGLDQRIQSA